MLIKEEMQIKFVSEYAQKIYEDGRLLNYQTLGSSGIDVRAISFSEYDEEKGCLGNNITLAAPGVLTNTETVELYSLKKGKRVLVRCGIICAVPRGMEMQMRSRSGLALKSGVIVVNSPGTIDSDYRGEMGALLCNTSNVDYQIFVGDRIAQMVIAPITIVDMTIVTNLTETSRGEGGFGSTGKN